METGAAAAALFHAHAAAQLAHHVLYRVQADATPGDLGNLVAHAEAGQEEEGQQLFLGQSRAGLGAGELARDHGIAQALQVHPGAVVGQLQQQHAGVVAGMQADHPLLRLAQAHAQLRALDAMVDRVAQ
ncbi:hypothetical protein D9M71_407070 [compost metagenome]